jgi:hemerythrin-like domain-containing protein
VADLFSELRKDHLEVLDLLDALIGDPASEGPDGKARRRLTERLVIEESKHEAVEERLFWPEVRARLQHGGELASTALEEETKGKKLLNEFEKTKPGTEEYLTLLHQVRSAIRRHIMYEENVVWHPLRAVMPRDEMARIGEEIAAGRATAPTRPHPNTPPSPRILSTVGVAVAATDRIRDVLTGRG